jgi:hypothetical protein
MVTIIRYYDKIPRICLQYLIYNVMQSDAHPECVTNTMLGDQQTLYSVPNCCYTCVREKNLVTFIIHMRNCTCFIYWNEWRHAAFTHIYSNTINRIVRPYGEKSTITTVGAFSFFYLSIVLSTLLAPLRKRRRPASKRQFVSLKKCDRNE